MAYYLAKFFRYIPQIDGIQHITCIDNFNIINVTTDAALAELKAHPDNIPLVEITQDEATEAHKWYGEVRGYRKAYSDVEGLTPDPDELAKGKRKTKISITPDIEKSTISLMKKAFKFHVDDEMENRKAGNKNLDGSSRPHYDANIHSQLHNTIDGLNTIKDIAKAREDILGIEMPKPLAVELGLWENDTAGRKDRVKFGVKF